MSDELHYSLNSSHVHELTIQILSQLPLEARGDNVQVEDILNVLVFAAAFRISINQACHDLEGAPTGATVLGELARQLPDLDEIEADLNKILAQLLPKGLGSKGRRVAIDLVIRLGRTITAMSSPSTKRRCVEARPHRGPLTSLPMPQPTWSCMVAATPWPSQGCARETRWTRCSRH